MGYDILARVIEFTESDLDIMTRMKKVAGLLVKDCPFDSCAFYTWDVEDRLFRLSVAEGSRNSRIEAYGENEGLPGLVKKTNRPVDVYTPRRQRTQGFQERRGISFKRKGQVVRHLISQGGKKTHPHAREKKDAQSNLTAFDIKPQM
jgi:hypothetical protein